MPTANLDEGRGKADFKQVFGTSSVADGDTIDTGLSTIESAHLDVVDDAAGTAVVNIRSISDGTVTVGSNTGTSSTVHYDVIGY